MVSRHGLKKNKKTPKVIQMSAKAQNTGGLESGGSQTSACTESPGGFYFTFFLFNYSRPSVLFYMFQAYSIVFRRLYNLQIDP